MYLSEDLIERALQEVTGHAYETNGVFRRVPSRAELDKYFQGCGDPGFAKTGYRYNEKVEWCGVFAAYLLREVGAKVAWKMNDGIQDLSGGNDIKRIEGRDGIRRGDIAVRGAGSHHFIVLDDIPPEKGFIKSVEGNSGGHKWPQMYCGRRNLLLAGVVKYYRVY